MSMDFVTASGFRIGFSLSKEGIRLRNPEICRIVNASTTTWKYANIFRRPRDSGDPVPWP